MTIKKVLFTVASVIGLALVQPRIAAADEWTKETVFTFKQTIEVPGKTLAPGTYTFRLADFTSTRHAVQVLDDKGHTLVVLFTAPVVRSKPDGSVLTFENTTPGQPMAAKQWFYPGRTEGEEFLYSGATGPVSARGRHGA